MKDQANPKVEHASKAKTNKSAFVRAAVLSDKPSPVAGNMLESTYSLMDYLFTGALLPALLHQ